MDFVLIGFLLITVAIAAWQLYSQGRLKIKFVESEAKSQGLNLELADFKAQVSNLEELNAQLKLEKDQSLEALVSLREKIAAIGATNDALVAEKSTLSDSFKSRALDLQIKVDSLTKEKEQLKLRVQSFEQAEEQRKSSHDKSLAQLNMLIESTEKDRQRLQTERESTEALKREEMKKTWSIHEKTVEEKIRSICQRQIIDYVEKESFPHRGKPDNAVKICDELVIFDSKSPGTDDLSNFPNYIKAQSEQAKKYVNYEGVRKDIFLVVPTNAIHVIENRYIVHGSYRVHVITEDALEPILINLKKLEDYEFAEKLSPDDREKIVNIIGKMAHGMKRRIQIDYFFANEYISTLSEAENLPEEFLRDAQKVEKGSVMNPPQDKRAKLIESKDLTKESHKLLGKAHGQNINLEEGSKNMELIPLHRTEE